MGQRFFQNTLHGLLGGTALWLLLGASSSLAYFGSGEIGAMPAQMRADRYASDILVAQIHHPPAPPVVPSVSAPVMAPPAQPKVFAPIPLPPDSQAIKSGGGTKSSSAPASGSSSSSMASSSASSAPAASDPKSSADPTVKGLQELLAELGYDPGPADGLPGNRTWDAIFTWIATIEDPDLQQEVRDAAHDQQYELLIEYAYVANESGQGATTKAEPTPSVADQVAETKKAAVKSVQQNLNSMGFDSGTADGLAGDHTIGAVNDWIDSLESENRRKLASMALENGDYGLLDMTMQNSPIDDLPDSAQVLSEQQEPIVHGFSPQEDGSAEQLFAASEYFVSQAPILNYYGFAFPVQYNPSTLYNNNEFYGAGLTVEEFFDYHIARAEGYLERAKNDYDANVNALKEMQQKYIDRTYEQILNTQKYLISRNKYWDDIINTPNYYSWKSDERYAAERASMQITKAKEAESTLKSISKLIAELSTLKEFKESYGYTTLKSKISELKIVLVARERELATMQVQKADYLAAQANVDAYRNNAQTEMVDLVEVHDQMVAAAEDEFGISLTATPEEIAATQNEIDRLIESSEQAKAEQKSLNARTDLSEEEKARVSDDIQSRIDATGTFLEEAKLKLAAEGGAYDGYDGKDFEGFDPYEITQTEVELYKIAEEAKAQEQFYDELSRAREIINTTTDGLDAAQLHDKVTDLSERVTEGAESYQQVAELLHEYGTNINTTRKQGELEYAQAMAEEAVVTAERNLAYAQSVVQTTKNAEAVLALGGMGYALATGGMAATVVVGAQSQAVMATLDGASTAIDGFDKQGFVAGVQEGLLQAGKYYVPVNTYLAVRDGKTDKTTLALAIVGDAANLFSNVQTLKSAVNKAYAAQARATQMGLSETDQAISRAAQAAKQNGDDLVRGYQNAKFEVETAMRSGSGADVSAAQDRLEQIIKAIDSSDEAKLALKTKGLSIQAEFVDDQARLIKEPAQEIWEQKMREMGWSDGGLETAQIRNQSSAGTVGLDDDIRLLEPSLIDRVSKPSLADTLPDGTPKYTGANDPAFLRDTSNYNLHPEKMKYAGPNDPNFVADTQAFQQRLTKNGEVQSLASWEHDAQQAMEDAYQEVAGYSAKGDARVEMTTSVSDEAFKDIRVLQEGGVNESSAGWAEQSASVTQTKMKDGIDYANQLGLGDGPATAPLTGVALQEATTEIKVATRELLKDLTGKAMRAKPGFDMPAKIDRQIQILQGVVDGTYDPAVANTLLKQQTGTSLAKTMESLGGHFEVLLKFN